MGKREEPIAWAKREEMNQMPYRRKSRRTNRVGQKRSEEPHAIPWAKKKN